MGVNTSVSLRLDMERRSLFLGLNGYVNVREDVRICVCNVSYHPGCGVMRLRFQRYLRRCSTLILYSAATSVYRSRCHVDNEAHNFAEKSAISITV